MDETFPASGALDMQGNGQRFGVSRWTAWEGGTDGAPDVSFVAAMLRRRLSRLSRLAVSVANGCLAEDAGIPIVLVSQHGELARTVDLLSMLARGEPLSPTAFSLSVHNSAAGLLTLTRAERAPATAIAAGPHSVAMGLLEAVSQAQERGGPVLLVCVDAQAPAPYREAVGEDAECALAALVTPGGEWVLETTDQEADSRTAPQVKALGAVFEGGKTEALLGDAAQSWRVRHA